MMEDSLSASSSGSGDNNREISASQQAVLVGGHNKYEWVYLLLSVPNALTLMALAGGLIYGMQCERSIVPCLCHRTEILIIIIGGVSIVFALYGLFAEHQYDMYLYSSVMLLGLYFSWFMFGMHPRSFCYYQATCNSIVTVLSVLCFYLAWKATHVPDWVEFWIIGVSEALTDMYRQSCYFLTFLRFDSLLIVVFAIFGVDIAFPGLRLDDVCCYGCAFMWGLYQGLMLLYALLSWSCGKLSVMKENMCLAVSFQAVNFSYIVYLVGQEALLLKQCIESFDSLYIYCIVLCAICIASKIYVMVQMKKTSKTFGHGLNTESFRQLVSRDSNSLLSHPRSDLHF